MKQVYFIGDNFEADVLGAENFGFTPVFLNRKNDTEINKKNHIEIKSLNGLLDVMDFDNFLKTKNQNKLER